MAIKVIKIFFQHDDNFINATFGHYSHNTPSPADFFIHKFDMKDHLTSKELRLKEENILSSLYSSSNVKEVPDRIRDFYALCNGKTLVSIKLVENVLFVIFHLRS